MAGTSPAMTRHRMDLVMTDIAKLEKELLHAIAAARDQTALEAVRVAAPRDKGGWAPGLHRPVETMRRDDHKTEAPTTSGWKDGTAAAIAAGKSAPPAPPLEARLNTKTVDAPWRVREAPAETGRVHP